MSKRRRGKLPPFVPLIKATCATPAWRAMTYGAREVYRTLRGQMANDASNNGKFYRSERDIAKEIGCNSNDSVSRWLQELEYYGFIEKTGDGFLGSDGRGIAARHRLTECATPDGKAATRDFDKWNGNPFKFVPPRPGTKKQNPVPKIGAGCTENRDIRKGQKGKPVCTENRDIDSVGGCTENRGISSIPSPETPQPSKKPWNTPTLVEVTDLLGAREWSAPAGSAVATERAPSSLISSSGSRGLH
jgi:hypothetical protein